MEKACYSYVSKNKQLIHAQQALARDRLFVLDYDQLITQTETQLPALFEFLRIPYRDAYSKLLNRDSLKKESDLTDHERATINRICMPSYENALTHVTTV